MKKIGIVILLLWVNSLVKAENNLMMAKANQHFHNKQYQEAAALYNQLLQDGYHNHEVYYNLGNTYYRLQNTGMAVWCFRKALLQHQTKNYQDNLLLAQQKIKEPIAGYQDIFFIRWWKSIVTVFSLNTWAILSLLFFLIGIGVKFYQAWFHRTTHKWLTKLSLSLCLFGLVMTGMQWYYTQIRYSGIIKHETRFRPLSKSETIILSEGVEVTYHGKVESGIMVKLPDGRVGQIEEADFLRL